ncbi:M14 family metallocarboxypeptidase [Bosea sp. BIWAKO-01]|uniref:M14 family metallopeptidase n=1 Tax=Bosea sp. BIWAKO-01 TaxID=506668 RepID=UPI000853CE43|nr:M14 family metallocarboxypeptidase [Bosea sp. BIWAKO-01]GAU83114.1 carboxypeptidase [Bosea sp. BIWAKO-01]
MKTRTAFALGLLALLGTAPALAQEEGKVADYKQSEAVLARYKSVPIPLATPSLTRGTPGLTTQAELDAFVADLAAKAPAQVVLGSLGTSQQGRDLPYLIFSKEGARDTAALRALGRPIVWFVGQQHGNEPAGGEAMLALANDLATTDLKAVLDKLVVVIVPRTNPDGAAADKRTGANGFDLNRDHLLLTLPETKALHAKLAELPPDVIVDVHEFSVANRWLEKFGGLNAADAMILYATNPAVPQQTTKLASELVKPAMDKAMAEKGLSSFWYFTTGYNKDDKVVSMGGNAPGIARNLFGLSGAVSFLIETRGVGLKLENLERRIATHYVISRSVLDTIAANDKAVLQAVAAARGELAKNEGELVVGHRIATVKMAIPLVNPDTAADMPTEVDFRDSRQVTVTGRRVRPEGYIVLASGQPAVEALKLKGIAVCALGGPASLDIEAFVVEQKGTVKKADRENINPDQAVKVELRSRRLDVPATAVFVPMTQSGANVIAASFEPDSPGSHVGVGLVEVAADSGEAPIYRVPRGARPILASGGDPACSR